ncbi:MAG: phosphatase PAP2 family protein [Gemmatimonadaceae bacterium]
MHVASSTLAADDAASRSDRLGRGIALALATYLTLVSWPIARYAMTSGTTLPLVVHATILGYTLVLLAAPVQLRRPALDWLTLTIGPLMYVELRWIITGSGAPHRDALVVGWESVLFPSNPSATLAPRLHVAWASELLHLAYASYNLLIYLPPIALYLRGRRDAFVSTMLALTVVYGICFITYALFPVDGPRYLVGAAAAPEGPIRSFVLTLLDRGSSRGTAFPSSHVAASVVSSLCALRHQRDVGILVTLVTVALTLATVYGGFHYAVDALVGVIVGVLAWLVSAGALERLVSRAVQSATAA